MDDPLGLPPSPTGEWIFSDVSNPGEVDIVAIPSGFFSPGGPCSARGFALSPGKPPVAMTISSFGDGEPISAEEALRRLRGEK